MSAQTTERMEDRQLPPSMVERVSLILDVFSSPAARLTLEEVARVTHLPRSTTHRILDQLVKLAWLAHTPFGYSLGQRALELGGGDKLDSELRAAAAPHLHELQVRTGMVAHLAALEGAEVRYLDKIGGRFASAVPSRVGGRAPADATALGKSMLAWLDPEDVDVLLTTDPSRYSGHSTVDLTTLHQQLHRVRSRNGLAFEAGGMFPDISCVAAAVRSPEGPIGAISLVGDLAAPVERVAPLVLQAARAVSVELFPGLDVRRRTHLGRGDAMTPPEQRGWSALEA